MSLGKLLGGAGKLVLKQAKKNPKGAAILVAGIIGGPVAVVVNKGVKALDKLEKQD